MFLLNSSWVEIMNFLSCYWRQKKNFFPVNHFMKFLIVPLILVFKSDEIFPENFYFSFVVASNPLVADCSQLFIFFYFFTIFSLDAFSMRLI